VQATSVRQKRYALGWAITLFFLFLCPVMAQQQDDVVVRARYLATHQKRGEALELLSSQLRGHPSDVDARLLYGLILSWEGRYDEARAALHAVLESHPDYTDAIVAAINVEMWDGHPERAAELALDGHRRQPTNLDFLFARAKAFRDLGRIEEAKQVLSQVLDIESGNRRAIEMRSELNDSPGKWEFSYDHNNIWFSDHRAAWREDRVSFRDITTHGSLFVRLYHANRFGYGSNLVEFEAYPHLRPGTYLYLAGAFSPDAQLYARYRTAADIFQSIKGGFEVSAGFRHFRFSTDFDMYTGSLAKYVHKWLLTLRTYIIPDPAGASRSFQLTARRFFADPRNYITLRFGIGASPFEVRSVNEIGILKSESAAFEYNRRFLGHWSVNFVAGASAEDRIERNGLRQYFLDGAIYYRF
jgi:YaiO family outer membrane protein